MYGMGYSINNYSVILGRVIYNHKQYNGTKRNINTAQHNTISSLHHRSGT